MAGIGNPETYEAWYHTPRGAWVGNTEFSLMLHLLRPPVAASLLDVGSGTGYFSRRFAESGLQVTGIDPNRDATAYAAGLDGPVSYVNGSVFSLPFDNDSFDYCAAVTSLCFVDPVEPALAEMWRVARCGILLGMLNRHSWLYRQKHGRGGYQDARWDTWHEISGWLARLGPRPAVIRHGTAIFLPGGGLLSRFAERLLPERLPWGGFLAIYFAKPF